MTNQPLDTLPIGGMYLVTVVVALILVEVGYRLGRQQQSTAEAKRGTVGPLVAATLALLTFLLVFITGMAFNRFESRRLLVIKEANTIRATYLRAGYLAEPFRHDIRQLLHEYVDIRLEAAVDPIQLPRAIARSEEIQMLLWSEAEVLAQSDPDSDMIALFIESLNGMIDVHGERVAAVVNRLSGNIWLAIFFVAGITMMIVGYQNGLAGNWNIVAVVALVAVFSAVILLIVDLDRPWQGLLQVSQQSLMDVQRQVQMGP